MSQLRAAVACTKSWSLPSLPGRHLCPTGSTGQSQAKDVAKALRIDPWFTINQAFFAKICKRPEDGKHFNDGMRKAGFPE